MGIQCCPLPTAFLSTHTGGFEGFTFLDMTDEMPRVAAHWKSLNLEFQAIYSGFLGSERQIAIVADFIRQFRRPDTLVVIDPVMGDFGKVYQTYTAGMCAGTARLAELADVITPNLTEAALLLDCPYDALPAGEAGCREIVERLSLEGRRSVVLTGASGEPGTTGAVCFDAATGRTGAVLTERVPREFHGTGDVFASVLTGALVQGADLFAAARRRWSSSASAGSGPPPRTCPCGRAWTSSPCWGCWCPRTAESRLCRIPACKHKKEPPAALRPAVFVTTALFGQYDRPYNPS